MLGAVAAGGDHEVMSLGEEGVPQTVVWTLEQPRS